MSYLTGKFTKLGEQESASFIAAMTNAEYNNLRSFGGWQTINNRSCFVTLGRGLVTLICFNRELSWKERISYNHQTRAIREAS